MSTPKSPKFRQIYQYIKNGYIKGPQSIREWIQLEAQKYVLLNDILCKISNTDNTNWSTIRFINCNTREIPTYDFSSIS